jgi:hypothetical protein
LIKGRGQKDLSLFFMPLNMFHKLFLHIPGLQGFSHSRTYRHHGAVE